MKCESDFYGSVKLSLQKVHGRLSRINCFKENLSEGTFNYPLPVSVGEINCDRYNILWNFAEYIVSCRGVVQLGVQILGITGVVPLRLGLVSLSIN